MKTTCNKYTSEEISKFVDNELDKDQYHELVQHIDGCSGCKGLVERYKTLSSAFNNHVSQQDLKIDPARLEQKLQKKSLGNIFGFFGKNKYLKLASITAILMVSLFAFQGDLFSPTGPSAIVKSVATDFASVMIIETQKEKHTIIWFSET